MIRALVVEDSPAMRQLMLMALRRIPDLVPAEAEDGMSALKILEQWTFDIILLDINMPIMDGLKLLELLRADARHKDTPVVVVTTEAEHNDRERALALGASAYVTKPVKAQQLVETVLEQLGLLT